MHSRFQQRAQENVGHFARTGRPNPSLLQGGRFDRLWPPPSGQRWHQEQDPGALKCNFAITLLSTLTRNITTTIIYIYIIYYFFLKIFLPRCCLEKKKHREIISYVMLLFFFFPFMSFILFYSNIFLLKILYATVLRKLIEIRWRGAPNVVPGRPWRRRGLFRRVERAPSRSFRFDRVTRRTSRQALRGDWTKPDTPRSDGHWRQTSGWSKFCVGLYKTTQGSAHRLDTTRTVFLFFYFSF